MKYYRPDEDKSSYSKHHKGKIEDYDIADEVEPRTVEDILSDVSDICIHQIMFNSDSAGICQKINMHGLKRVHRHLSKKFHCYYLELLNNSINDYDHIPESHSEFRPYSVSSFKDHLYYRLELLQCHIRTLGELSKEFFCITGVVNCDIERMLHCMYKSLCKTRRVIQRFDFTEWAPHDIMMWDYYLHKKMKKVESKEGYHKE